MIVKDIIKKKPLVHLSTVREIMSKRREQEENATAPETIHYPVVPAKPAGFDWRSAKSQYEYNVAMDDWDFDEYDFVTHRHVTHAKELYQVFYVGRIIVDYEKIPGWSAGGYPLSVHTLGCWPGAQKYNGHPTEFVWDPGFKYRRLRSDESVLLIDDHVRNYVKEKLARLTQG